MASDKEKISTNELEMAKKRNHKIMITNGAIEKVPLVKYKGIPESEYLMLQELAKEVLTVSKNDNDGNSIHDYQKAVFYFLSNCHEANIIFEDR